MARYVALIDGEAGAYGISFPDAPGCTAMADTQEDLLSAAADALAEWVADELADGRRAPPARSVEALRQQPDVAEALRSGAVLASVPLLIDTGKPARANISLDAGLLAEIDDAARQRGVTRSAFLAAAARDRIKAGA
jgi:predicted RNase H-like HicB family nuclease